MISLFGEMLVHNISDYNILYITNIRDEVSFYEFLNFLFITIIGIITFEVTTAILKHVKQ